jgi:hypothetical protein
LHVIAPGDLRIQANPQEGAVIAGYPSDATEDAVQANIVAAGYGKQDERADSQCATREMRTNTSASFWNSNIVSSLRVGQMSYPGSNCFVDKLICCTT